MDTAQTRSCARLRGSSARSCVTERSPALPLAFASKRVLGSSRCSPDTLAKEGETTDEEDLLLRRGLLSCQKRANTSSSALDRNSQAPNAPAMPVIQFFRCLFWPQQTSQAPSVPYSAPGKSLHSLLSIPQLNAIKLLLYSSFITTVH